MPIDAVREAIEARFCPERPRPDTQTIADEVRRVGGETVLAIVFFGSRKTGAKPNQWSAYDLFVLTRDYRSFYRSLATSGAYRRSPRMAVALNAVLPPNQVSLKPATAGEAPWRAKCAVITLRRLILETSPRRSDHFCAGRLFQPAELIWSRDGEVREAVFGAVASAHRLTWDWSRPWLPATFDTDDYCRTLLRVSFGREIRPELVSRAEALFEAQRDDLRPVYSQLLAEWARAGQLIEIGPGRYRLALPVSPGDRRRAVRFFRRSLIRATARWLKYMMTFDDWLDYLVRKVERQTGERVKLSERERRWPLLFLWPRFFRFMGSRGGPRNGGVL